jgi:hypothetical protein
MIGVVSEFAELAFFPAPFRVLKPEDLLKKACNTKDYEKIIEFKNYIWDLAICRRGGPSKQGSVAQ